MHIAKYTECTEVYEQNVNSLINAHVQCLTNRKWRVPLQF